MAASGEHFRRVLASFDQDGDGKISASELRLCMRAATVEDASAEDVSAVVASADADGDGLLDEEELEGLMMGMEAAAAAGGEHGEDGDECRWLREAFGMYEMAGTGRITPLSLKLMLAKLGAHQDIAECQAMICRFDMDGDGVLSFDEFRTMMLMGSS